MSTFATNPRLAWALRLAALDWPVFPLLAGRKVPALHGDSPAKPCPRTGPCRDGHQGWEALATTDPRVIQRHWANHPGHNIGLPAGRAGLLVVDLDMPHPDHHNTSDERTRAAVCGAQVLARLTHEHGHALPDTWTVTTPSGGTHLYFRQPAGMALRNSAGKLGPLVDTRGHGGYVVAPGSATVDGGYEVVSECPPAVLPVWLVHLLADRPSTAISAPRRIASDAMGRWLTAAIEGETRRVRAALPGGHNKAQSIAAYNLGRLVGGGHLAREHAAAVLSSAVADHVTGPCGCTQRGTDKVIAWGLDTGARKPRHVDITVDTEGSAA